MSKQFIYTSCKTGIDGVTSGYQILSHSKNLDPNDKEELKRLSGYRAPTDRSRDSKEDGPYPQAFLFTILSSGRICLGLTSYLIHDYMGVEGRRGVYMSHFLVLEKDDLEKYPCSYYKSPSFRDSLEHEEVNLSERPDYLPEIQKIQDGISLTIPEIINFIREGRKDLLISLISAVLEYNDSANQIRKKILLIDDEENIIKWIAAIQYVFPIMYASCLTFCSYVYSPMLSNTMLNGVLSSGTDFILGSPENSRYYYVYDCTKNVYPQLNSEKPFYKMIEASYNVSNSNLKGFHSFLENYSLKVANNEIHDAFTLFQIIYSPNLIVSDEEIFRALHFEQTYGNPNTQSNLLKKILNLEKTVVNDFSLESKEKISKILLDMVSGNNGIKADREIVYQFLINVVFSTLSTINTDQSYSELCSFYDTLIKYDKTIGGSYGQVIKKSISIQFASNLDGIYSNAFYLIHIFSNLNSINDKVELPQKNDDNSNIIKVVFDNLSRYSSDETCRCLILVINELTHRKTLFAFIHSAFKFIRADEIKKCIWNSFRENIKKSDILTYEMGYDYFLSQQNYYLTYNLFKSEYSNTSQKSQIVSKHIQKYVLKNNGYSKKYGKDILTSNLQAINQAKEETKYHELFNTLQFINSIDIEPSDKKQFYSEIISILPFSEPEDDVRKIIQLLSKIDRDLIHTDTSLKFYLLYWGMNIEKESKPGELKSKLNDQLKFLDIKGISNIAISDRKTYANWILPVFLQSVEQYEDHDAIINRFAKFLSNKSIDDIYITAIKDLISVPQKNQLFYTLFEYCALDSKDEHPSFYSYVIDQVYGLSDNKRKVMFDEILQKSYNQKKLKIFMDKVTFHIIKKREQTVLGRVKKGLGRIKNVCSSIISDKKGKNRDL